MTNRAKPNAPNRNNGNNNANGKNVAKLPTGLFSESGKFTLRQLSEPKEGMSIDSEKTVIAINDNEAPTTKEIPRSVNRTPSSFGSVQIKKETLDSVDANVAVTQEEVDDEDKEMMTPNGTHTSDDVNMDKSQTQKRKSASDLSPSSTSNNDNMTIGDAFDIIPSQLQIASQHEIPTPTSLSETVRKLREARKTSAGKNQIEESAPVKNEESSYDLDEEITTGGNSIDRSETSYNGTWTQVEPPSTRRNAWKDTNKAPNKTMITQKASKIQVVTIDSTSNMKKVVKKNLTKKIGGVPIILTADDMAEKHKQEPTGMSKRLEDELLESDDEETERMDQEKFKYRMNFELLVKQKTPDTQVIQTLFDKLQSIDPTTTIKPRTIDRLVGLGSSC